MRGIKMRNTYEYTGKNVDTLEALGYGESDNFVTFKQALKLDGVSGKKLKGIKAAARLVMYKIVEDEDTGKKTKKPRYFSVFNVKDVMKKVNG
jgi:antirestriction protein ArdC